MLNHEKYKKLAEHSNEKSREIVSLILNEIKNMSDEYDQVEIIVFIQNLFGNLKARLYLFAEYYGENSLKENTMNFCIDQITLELIQNCSEEIKDIFNTKGKET